ncbi:MAG: helix-turn-helix domain-containing protein [Candidatus Lokiarchaeota archaeon]|nr:helix-turn-helix domain-containing protein [Candidatus Lokiarchaeota archaeon]
MELEEQEGREHFLSIDNLFEILGNPTRRKILSKLSKVPLGASELAASFGRKISRQAIHSQLKMLSDYGIIEIIGDDPRNIKYLINSNLSLRIDITPDYYNISFNVAKINDPRNNLELKDTGCHIDYQKIKTPNNKLRFLGERIKEIEENIRSLEMERKVLLHNKECFIIELKNIMRDQYEEDLKTKEQPNLEKEIFYTLFYNPIKYFKRINIDKLLDDIFFSEMGPIRRDQHKVSIRHLLRDLSKLMDFVREDEDNWFFDI